MTNHPDTTVRVPHGELGPLIGYHARSAYDGSHASLPELFSLVVDVRWASPL